ncbi:oxidoreductase [Cuneatibacter caecimuris]|uniref:2,4-dienoyl-CoA reductase-like NADH-dependent reductase (Old Yellow Enzyme family) n=1 Tax=Cuneatibacter caecimuris TaxID=1796618 RepID=A0A4V2F881_9FIRM|nr:flavin oxidoreductase/NADH oxidase [Cuneatibacter caecimuris]RZT02497.1 2,4-dienoyl-CoA reductase-like NADH-dependent reductase (Old Yellow Enzyme family) [Cuneatibacter caecimuris]
MQFEKFHYDSLKSIQDKAAELGVTIPLSEDMKILAEPMTFGSHSAPNRLAIQPMEGCDSTPEGAPDVMTKRRYRRFAQSGAGLIWYEATAVVREGRANPLQSMLTEQNVDEFKALITETRDFYAKEHGYQPVIILQATHSGRYSKPDAPAPMIACHNPVLEKTPLPDSCIVTDDYLKGLAEAYGRTARLAKEAGFDGIDIKACHRYLFSELLSAYTRPGIYGGDFENRTRMIREAYAAAEAAVTGDFIFTSRMNTYDAIPYPYGFGVSKESELVPDVSEPIALIKRLQKDYGLELIDLTIGNPYFNPHVNRPYDIGAYEPPYHPLESVARAAECFRQVKEACPDVKVIGSAVTYLRQYSANLAAGMVEQGYCDMAGFGRQAFAYPEFAKDILTKGCLDPKKCCVTCSKCTELMRSVAPAGCVVRDSEAYMPLYRQHVLNNEKDVRHMVSNV